MRMSDVLTPSQRKYCMSRIRGKNTKPELHFRKVLWAGGFRYRLKNRLAGKPDIVFPGKHLVIFVDGCFWHGCPEHSQVPKSNRGFWEEKLAKNKARDQEVNAILMQQGWKVLRFWEHEIKKALPECVERVASLIQETEE
ncbi:very short patch repair endonuclease [Methylomonas denitrificans]|uniref:Very short patch repair endonuclease n=3 Tax=Methylomonas TaxID=416 RepID=A0A126T4A9_9GAMM|nr:very short patch repair endonuclease [Methylomonas denitrificans]OAH96734.1 very short patch repair endonuclease [Methylomonas methanica]